MPKEMNARAWTALFSLYVIWGSTYLAIRYAIATIPPLLMAGTRFVLAGAVMYVIGRKVGAGRAQRPTRAHWVSATVVGLCLPLGGNGLVTLAEQRAPHATGAVALLIAMVPIWVAVFEWVRHRTKLRPLTVAGLGAGFAGAALLAVARGGTALDLLAALYALCAGAIWASGSVYARRAVVPESPIVFTGMELLTGGIALTIVGSLAGEWRSFHLDMVTASSAGGWLYLLVVGSIIGFTSYTWLLRNVRPQIATTYAYVNPLIAVLLGVAFNHERLTLATVVAGAVIVGAVATIVLSAGRDAAASPRAAPEASAELPV